MIYDDRLRKEDWEVRTVPMAVGRELVEKHHYARSASKTGVYVHGLFFKGSNECQGVAWWLPPTKNAAVATYPEGPFQKVLSLTRLVVTPATPLNACSFLLARSIKLIDNLKWECLVTYADTWQNHSGTIYKATNWQYMGLTKPSPVWQNKEGKMMGKKRGKVNFTDAQMRAQGFELVGKFSKHKFRMIL